MTRISTALNMNGATIEHKLAKMIIASGIDTKSFKITMIESPMFYGHWAARVEIKGKEYTFNL